MKILLSVLLLLPVSGYAGEGPVRETLARTGEVFSAPARMNRASAITTGGVAAGALLAYSLDGQARAQFAKNHSRLNDDLAKTFEKFGDGTYGLGLLGLFGGICYLKDSDYGSRSALLGLESFIAANAAGTVVKVAAGRARPYAHLGKGAFRPFKAKTAYTSFPSGHTTSAFSIASVFAARCDSPWLKATFYSLAAGTGLQRVYADKHWLSDVVVGAALGTAVGRHVVAQDRKGEKPTTMLLPVFTPDYSGAAAVFAF